MAFYISMKKFSYVLILYFNQVSKRKYRVHGYMVVQYSKGSRVRIPQTPNVFILKLVKMWILYLSLHEKIGLTWHIFKFSFFDKSQLDGLRGLMCILSYEIQKFASVFINFFVCSISFISI